jgi:hypothetical protein
MLHYKLHEKTRFNSRAIATRLPNSIANALIAMAEKHDVSISEFLGNMITNCYHDWDMSERDYKRLVATRYAKKSSERLKLLGARIDKEEVGNAGEQPTSSSQSDRSDESPIGGNTSRDFWKKLGLQGPK